MAPRFAPRRELGRTGFVATRIGIGDLADRSVPLADCVATLRRALDFGLNLVDTAPSYENGYSEQVVGHALAGRRSGVFVIDKIDHFDRPVAAQADESLQRLQLPSVDAFVLHGVKEPAQWEELAKPGGAFSQLEAAVKDGRARFKGISAHHPDVLRRAIESGRCDLVLFSVGAFVEERYVQEILPLAKERGVGSVCFKTFGAGKLLGDTAGYGQPLAARPRGKWSSGGKDDQPDGSLPRLSVRDCVSYTLTCDPDVALLGMRFPNEQGAALSAAERFEPLLSRKWPVSARPRPRPFAVRAPAGGTRIRSLALRPESTARGRASVCPADSSYIGSVCSTLAEPSGVTRTSFVLVTAPPEPLTYAMK
jgi:aryl-alcohol dehydrogenase-like predicted oxidoreductase